MIRIYTDLQELDLNEIVQSAFERSCGVGSAKLSSNQNFIDCLNHSVERTNKDINRFDILVFINPLEEIAPSIIEALNSRTIKVIVFGKVPASLAHFLGATATPVTAEMKAAALCVPAKTYQYSESAGAIIYKRALEMGVGNSTLPSRTLSRFDFTNEWNNLGFGAISADHSIWAISQKVDISGLSVIAELVAGGKVLSAYAGLWDFSQASLLWFNRTVGPVDSYEWYLVEQFIAEYRFDDIPAWPVISEIPYGYESAVTMRLDCDEDIDSARALGDVYREKSVPFSLALHAMVLSDANQQYYPKEVLQSGGAILSHTLTHAPNWGGSEDAAKHEGNESARIIHEAIGVKPRYAVSPFHHTPGYARKGLADSGYQGCVGGIISSDPDFVMARAGRPPHSQQGFIGHSQQCMLHGDCMLEDGDALAIFKRAYEQAKISKTFFGYLDHPFSPRYQYGWISEEQRIRAHFEFIEYIQKSSNKPLFLNQNDTLDFLRKKSTIGIYECNGQLRIDYSGNENESKNEELKIYIQYGASQYPLSAGGVTL